ncbi:MAG: hypothetical protein A2W25_11870 [candidate division Zixibacteria bacterium RBG_16_53_22]|nr:MAG: hypothetical protein A2W25_11870 [candidate division Zixibacteria bacterium RBG_16_53_22]
MKEPLKPLRANQLIETLACSRTKDNMGHFLNYELYISDGIQLFPMNKLYFDIDRKILIFVPEHVKIDLEKFYDRLEVKDDAQN